MIMTWDELRRRGNDPKDMDGKLMWRLLAIATTHPSYSHLNPCQVFEAVRKELQEKV